MNKSSKPTILSPPGAPKIGSGTTPANNTGASATSVKNPMKTGSQATVKTPKTKKMADGFGKPSLFFKKENFGEPKKPSIQKLKAFLDKVRSK